MLSYLKRNRFRCIFWLFFSCIVSVLAPLKTFQLKWLIDSTSLQEAFRYMCLILGITVLSFVFESLCRKIYARIATELRLVLLLPYHPSERAVVLPAGLDASFYPPGMEAVPRRLAIVRANEYMAKHCGLLIAYAVLQNSNPGRIMRKVLPGCAVINLADDEG